jgi:hypothetical protein
MEVNDRSHCVIGAEKMYIKHEVHNILVYLCNNNCYLSFIWYTKHTAKWSTLSSHLIIEQPHNNVCCTDAEVNIYKY